MKEIVREQLEEIYAALGRKPRYTLCEVARFLRRHPENILMEGKIKIAREGGRSYIAAVALAHYILGT